MAAIRPLRLEALEPRLMLSSLPELQAGFLVQDGGALLEVDYTSVATVVDWDNDGCADLVVGQFTSGNVILFPNQGTAAAPAFNGSSPVQSGGTPITTEYG